MAASHSKANQRQSKKSRDTGKHRMAFARSQDKKSKRPAKEARAAAKKIAKFIRRIESGKPIPNGPLAREAIKSHLRHCGYKLAA